MTKDALRKRCLTDRRALSDEAVQTANRAIFHQLTELLRDAIRKNPALALHTFLPIRRQQEIDTWPIIHWLWRNFPEVRTASSVTDVTTRQLTHYWLTPDTVLTPNRWDIPEPTGIGEFVPATTIDAVVVPLLAFDRRGHRVGYGGGFYDRFLAGCRPDCQRIGLSFVEPVDQISDIEPTDIALDCCITPSQVYRFPTVGRGVLDDQ